MWIWCTFKLNYLWNFSISMHALFYDLCVVLKEIQAQADMLKMERKLVEAREKLAKIRKARYTDKNTCKTNKN